MQKQLNGRFPLKTNIYLDTTIISALFDKRTPERMSQTRQFWEHIDEYNVFISELVIDEIKGASQPLQDEMLKKVSNFTLLPVTDNAQYLVKIKTRRMVTLINAIHNYNPVEIIAPPEL
jgi:predicted nucleic acid-binding protein